MNPLGQDLYEETRKQSKMLAMRMRCTRWSYAAGTGVGKIMGSEDSNTHYMDGSFSST